MAYKALYRAYRPQLFSEVVGQSAIVKTLQNAIMNNKISHAYLFCGPRGTGKTSVARIFAKALNCTNLQENGEPCGECVPCKEISESFSPDVVEIDAASNNGVDEIRDIREKVKFLPSGSKYKIYIVDEVHMLSTGAFNALLKILEEPPKHVIFILATTEPQKLPSTIISRCQKFEFKPLNVNEISDRLKLVCDAEGVTISDEALQTISEVADGGMRDALSILDQTISYGNKEINLDDVNTITGSINVDTLCNLMEFLDVRDSNGALDLINNLIKEGKEASKIINGMLLYCRDLLLYKSVGSQNYSKYIFEKERFQEIAFKTPSSKIIYYIEILCDVQNKIKFTTSPGIYLEIAIIKMANITNEELDIIKRMDSLEEKMQNTTFSTEEVVVGIDGEKLGLLDTKINQVVSELNKLELPKLSKKVDDISQVVANKINSDQEEKENEDSKLNSRIIELESEFAGKLIDLENKINASNGGEVVSAGVSSEELVAIKNEINELREKANQNSKGLSGLREEELEDEIEKLNNRIDSLSVPQFSSENQEGLSDAQYKYLYNEIETLKSAKNNEENEVVSQPVVDDNRINEINEQIQIIINTLNSLKRSEIGGDVDDIDKYEFNEMKEKVELLEKKLYELVAGKLSDGKDKVKPAKKSKGRVMLFDSEILTLEDLARKEESKADFGDLTKTEEDIEEENNISEDNVSDEAIEEFEDNASNENTSDENTSNEVVEQESIEEDSINVYVQPKVEEKKAETLFDMDEDEAVEEEIQEPETEENISSETNEEKPSDDIEFKPDDEKINDAFIKVYAAAEADAKREENKVINQYYNESNKESVINKTHSSIVIRDEDAEEVAPKVEPKPQVQPVQNEIISHKKETSDKFAAYDIHDVEQMMYDACSPQARNDRARIYEIWPTLLRGISPSYLSVAEILSDGKVAVVGNKELLLTFKNVSLCNEVMKKRFKDDALRLLYTKLGDFYNYIAVPEDVWAITREESRSQYEMGIRKPRLKPFNIKGLNISDDNEFVDSKTKTINSTINMFGEDIVKIK